MISQPLFIPLYFDEGDMDLWTALQTVDPQMRSVFIKETLRQALLGEHCQKPINEQGITENITVIPEESGDETQMNEIPSAKTDQAETFSLDDLFSQTSSLEPKENPNINMAAQGEVKPLPGFEYLMKHIIGMEEDEAVLRILQGKA